MILIVRELDDYSIPRCRQYLELDPASNIYALSSLLSKSEGSRFLIATSNDGELEGALVIRRAFKRPFVWLVTDTDEATRELARILNFQNASIWVKPEYETILEQALNKIPCKIEGEWTYDIMELDRRKVKLDIKHEWRRLSEGDAYAWAKTEALAELEEKEGHEAHLENVEPTEERIQASVRLLRTLSCFGILDTSGKSIIARSAIEELAGGTAIRRVFTNPYFRNQGYGRSITSVAVQESMKNLDSPRIVLFVLQNNSSAKRIYETIGFSRVASRTEFELVPSI